MRTNVCLPNDRIDDLLRVSRYHAAQMGLVTDDVEDCAVEFAEHMLFVRERRPKEQAPAECPSAWLHRCARNHAIDYRRSLSRRHQRHVSWSVSDTLASVDMPADWLDTSAGPDHIVLHREFWEILENSFSQLDPAAQALFLQRYVYNRRLRDLAAGTDRSEQAMEQALRRIRRRLRGILERAGVTEANLRAYLAVRATAALPTGRRNSRSVED